MNPNALLQERIVHPDSWLRDAEAHALSGDQIKKLVPDAVITLYSQMYTKGSIGEITGPTGLGVVLFVTAETASETSGHWLGVIRRDASKEVLLFDPYGGKKAPWFFDHTFVSARDLKAFHETAPYLWNLVKQSGFDAVFNETRFQRMSSAINTCGRHVVVRLQHAEEGDEAYKSWLLGFPNPPDITVTLLTTSAGPNV